MSTTEMPFGLPNVDEDERLDARGTLHTHIECPHCDEYFELEGDAADDKVECPWCNAKLVVRRTA
jgi:uncharacterized paraquat-inducible protein A